MTCSSSMAARRPARYPIQAPNLFRSRRRKPSRKRDEFNPIRLLAHRIGLELRQRAFRLIDRINRHGVGQFADCREIAATWIDIEAAWLRLGRYAGNRGQKSAGGIDRERRQRVRGAFGSIKKARVWSEMDIGGPWLAVEAGRQRGGALQFTPATLVLIVSEGEDGTVQFVQQIDKLVAGVEREVPRPRLVGDPRRRRIIGRELTRRGIELEAEHLVRSEIGGEHVTVVGIGLNRVRVEAE